MTSDDAVFPEREIEVVLEDLELLKRDLFHLVNKKPQILMIVHVVHVKDLKAPVKYLQVHESVLCHRLEGHKVDESLLYRLVDTHLIHESVIFHHVDGHLVHVSVLCHKVGDHIVDQKVLCRHVEDQKVLVSVRYRPVDDHQIDESGLYHHLKDHKLLGVTHVRHANVLLVPESILLDNVIEVYQEIRGKILQKNVRLLQNERDQ